MVSTGRQSWRIMIMINGGLVRASERKPLHFFLIQSEQWWNTNFCLFSIFVHKWVQLPWSTPWSWLRDLVSHCLAPNFFHRRRVRIFALPCCSLLPTPPTTAIKPLRHYSQSTVSPYMGQDLHGRINQKTISQFNTSSMSRFSFVIFVLLGTFTMASYFKTLPSGLSQWPKILGTMLPQGSLLHWQGSRSAFRFSHRGCTNLCCNYQLWGRQSWYM